MTKNLSAEDRVLLAMPLMPGARNFLPKPHIFTSLLKMTWNHINGMQKPLRDFKTTTLLTFLSNSKHSEKGPIA